MCVGVCVCACVCVVRVHARAECECEYTRTRARVCVCVHLCVPKCTCVYLRVDLRGRIERLDTSVGIHRRDDLVCAQR